MSISDNDSDLQSGDSSFCATPSLNRVLASQFSEDLRNFNAVHINAQSIPAHFTDMLATFNCMNIHAILISESWLKPTLSTVSYTLPGYKLIRNDRVGSRGGGVAIYLRDNIIFKVISLSSQPPPLNAGEHLFIEIELQHTKLLLGVYYCPSSSINFFLSFENLLENLVPSYSNTIVMGDFNTCLERNDHRSNSFKSVTQSCNLSILPLHTTHHFPNSTPSLLDLILVSSPNLVSSHGQYTADAFSCHDLIYLSYKLRPPKARSKILMQRNFGGVNVDNLRTDASSLDWSRLYNSQSIDHKINIFNAAITHLYDKHAPIRPIRLKYLPAPWLTDEIRTMLSKKAAAKSRYNRRSTDVNWEKYVIIRNHCNKVVRDAQRRHIHNSVENGEPAKIWKFLKSLGVGKSENHTLSGGLDVNSLNNYFVTSSQIDKTSKDNTLKYLSSLPTPDYSPFVFTQFSDCDVKKSILSITSKAVGSDSVSRNMILPILDIILPTISHILNFSISSGSFPTLWKEAIIVPIPKKPNPSSYSEYRPISILPFLSKVLEKLVQNQLSLFLNLNGLLNPYQSGFRPGHSTVTALVKITEDIRLAMDNKQLTVLTLLDFSNAFNTVDFDILLGVLCSLNISSTVIEWFQSYLLGRRQRIRVDDSYSTWSSTIAGVPQGGVLSPLLFAIFINSISNNLHSSYHLYADDLQIYTHAPVEKIDDAINLINQDLSSIAMWSKSFGLKINPIKTQTIIVGSTRMRSNISWSTLPCIKFDGVLIPFNEVVKNLGIFIDSSLSWGPQVQETSRKVFASAAALRRLQYFLPHVTKISLAQSLLLPILDYADVCYLDLAEYQLDKLERLQNFCIRFIFGLRKYDHISEFRKKLKWLPIRLRRNTHILSLLYNTLFNPKSPRYLKEHFKFLHYSNSRFLRLSENMMLKTPIHKTQFYGKSFVVQAVQLWNALPLSIRKAQSIASFNSQVKEFYLKL